MSSRIGWRFSVCASVCLLAGFATVLRPEAKQAKGSAGPASAVAAKNAAGGAARIAPPKNDLSAAMKGHLPSPPRDLEPASFGTPDGRTGWVLRLPGNRPIATPAYADGMLFVGGGYGSHEFYAVDADTGKIIWKIQTGDDGPTAAVVADGMVAFNTESCTLVIVDERRGRVMAGVARRSADEPARHRQ